MSLLTSTVKTDLYRFFSIAFNAAPGVTYMSQMADAVNAGMSVKQIVNVFTTKAEFTSVYPSFFTAEQFANKIVETVVGTSATTAAKTQAKADVAAALNSGMSRGDVVFQIFTNLANKPATDADWAGTAQQMANKVAVAQYFTEELLTDTTNLATLRATIANVTNTSDVSTPAKIQAVLDVAVPVDPQSFTLTTGSDVRTLGAGADSFFGSLTTAGTTDTLTAGDNLNGGAGVDTLFISANGTGAIAASNPTLVGIEKVLVSNAVSGTGMSGVTVDLSLTDSAVTTVGTSASATATNETLFRNVGKNVAVEIRGVGDVELAYLSSVVSGTGDAQSLTLNGVGTSSSGLSTFDVNGIETLNITSATAANFAKMGAGTTTVKAVNVSGGQALTLDLTSATGVTSINASSATAAVTAVAIPAGNVTVTGGSANDVFNFGTGFNATTQTGATQLDVVAGGAGTDTIVIDQGTGANADAIFGQVTSVETLTLNGTGAGNVTMDARALAAGINTVNLSGTANSVVNIGTGFAGSLTVNLSTGADNTVSNNAASTTNVTVNAAANAITTSDILTGATGAAVIDTIVLTANGNDGTGTGSVGAVFGTGFTNYDQITVAANTGTATLGVEITLDAANVGSGKTLAVNAAALTSSSAALYLDGSSGATGSSLNVTGGAGNDTIILGAGNDVVNGGAGNDVITAGAGNDNLSGGAGNDTFNFGESLSTGDTVVGGDGIDTIVLGTGAVTSAMFANVSGVENLQFSGSATLTGNIPFTSFDMSAATGAGTLTLGSGYTNATTVTLGAGDSVTNTGANVALTVNVTAADYGTGTGAVVNGGTGTDTLNITASFESTGSGTVTLAASSRIDVINVIDAGDAATGTTAAGRDMFITLGSGYSANLTVDASSLDAGTTATGTDSENLSFDAALIGSTFRVNVTGGAGRDTITGGAGNDTINGGAGADSITAGAGFDRLDGGAGNDTFVMGDNLSGDDVIAGGADTDTISVGTGAVVDLSFLQVTSIERLAVGTGGGSLTLDLRAQAAGVTTVTVADATTATGTTTTVNAIGYTTGLTIDASAATAASGAFSFTGGAGNDTFIFAGSGVVSASDSVVGGAGTDVFTIANGTGAGTAANLTLGAGISGIESFVVTNTAASTGTAGVTVSLDAAFGTGGSQATFNFDASALGTGMALTFTNGATGDVNTTATGTQFLAVTVTGGAGNDTITGGDGSLDVINLSVGGADTVRISTANGITAVDQITGFIGGTGSNGDVLDLFGTGGIFGTGATNLIFGWDADGTGTGAATTTAFDMRTANQDVTLGDGVGTGAVPTASSFLSDTVMVVNGASTLDLTKVVSTSTAAKGELIVSDGASAYVLQAAETTSTTFNIYRVYDSSTGTAITPEVDLVGQVTLASGTFADLRAANVA